jgi:hypothetical protein
MGPGRGRPEKTTFTTRSSQKQNGAHHSKNTYKALSSQNDEEDNIVTCLECKTLFRRSLKSQVFNRDVTGSQPSRVVERDSNKNFEIDKGIRNCWKWDWMETRSEHPKNRF